MGLETSGQHGDFNFGADGLIGFHVEALDLVSAINFGDELGMERDDDCHGDEDTEGVEGTATFDITGVEWQIDRGFASNAAVLKESKIVDHFVKVRFQTSKNLENSNSI